ncbi:hypothetical protein [Hyphomicrobium sp.]|uniref:hypothetical protein n=1 Tax=Hyphomicrobium sp. TaxID=82 RepID=UPI001D3421C9|nr:hypothetical protein [Hyphomicrobium sp.]MBY0561898.1 hypothetical protein [Hyphomicrobium sp.]
MKLATTAALLGASMLAFTATTASADIVCNGDGDCWHVKERHKYSPDLHLQVHPDGWKWRESDAAHHRWREHEGHGYWRSGVWVDL